MAKAGKGQRDLIDYAETQHQDVTADLRRQLDDANREVMRLREALTSPPVIGDAVTEADHLADVAEAALLCIDPKHSYRKLLRQALYAYRIAAGQDLDGDCAALLAAE